MVQSLLRSYLVCSITLLTFGEAVEVLKSSEFEDKEIPFLLNWKGEKQEKNHEIDASWWRWVQEENGKTITEETARNARDKNGHTLFFKRSVEPFRPNINALKYLLDSDTRHGHQNQKRWISSSFGFGSKKKSRKDSKQPLVELRKSGQGRVTPSPKVVQGAGDDSLKVRINCINQDLYNGLSDCNVLNSTYRMRGPGNNFGQSLDVRDQPSTWKRVRPGANRNYDKLNDVEVSNNSPSDHYLQLSKYMGEFQNSKTSTTHHPVYATSGKMSGDLQSTRRFSVDPRYWNKYTTETIFERVFEPFTELRFNPQRMKFPFAEMSLTSKKYTERPYLYATIDGGLVKSKYESPIRSREQPRSGYPQNYFLHVKKTHGGTDPFSVSKKDGRGLQSNQNLDVFDQIAIPSISNSDTFEQFHKIEKISRNNYDGNDATRIRYKYRDLINNVLPSLKTQKNFKRKQIVVGASEGVNYEIPQEEEGPYENSLASLPAKLQAKGNRNHTNNTTSARNSAIDTAKGCNHHCGGGGSCGKCGGGVNISIMMPSPPVLSPTVDNGAAQISHSTSASDRNKKKKERKKKPSKNSEDSEFEPVVSGKKEKSYVKSKSLSAYRRYNDSFMLKNKLFSIPVQQRSSTLMFGITDESSKNQTKTLDGALGGISESTKHNMSYDTPHGNFSSWNYLNIMHQMHQPIPPTVFGALPTLCGPAEDEDDDDELKELYDEQNSTMIDNNAGPSTKSYTSHSKSTQPYGARNFFFGKHAHNNALEKIGVLDKLKNNRSGSKLSGRGKDNIKYPSLSKKSKDSYPKKEITLEVHHEPWEKYSFPKEQKSGNITEEKSKMYHQVMSKKHSYPPQRNQEYLVPNDDGQQSEYYDQWEALDADLSNDLTGGVQGDLRVRARNRKRDVENEDPEDDAQIGYYRLSSGSSLRNPSSMIVSAFRRAKMNHEKRPVVYEEIPPEGEIISANPTTAAHTSN